MASWIYCLFVFDLMFISNGGADFGMKTSDNYGPYIVEWDNSSVVCHGPKSVNISSHTHIMQRQADGSYRYIMNVTFKDSVRIEEIRMTVNTIKEGKKSLLWNVKVNKPCQHYMLAAMLETYFGVKNCYVKKGEMYVNLPLTDLMVKYIGPSFFYGDYIFKVVVMTKTANLACMIFDPKFKKKTKKPSS